MKMNWRREHVCSRAQELETLGVVYSLFFWELRYKIMAKGEQLFKIPNVFSEMAGSFSCS